MLFSRPSSSLFTKTFARRPAFVRRAALSSSKETGAEAASEEGASGGLVLAVGTTFVTYMTADFLSNFIQHPTQKVSLHHYFRQLAHFNPELFSS